MPLPRRPLKHLRRAIFKAVRHRFPALQRHLTAERQARLVRDLRRLRAIAASRPELQIQITYGDRFDGVGGQALSVISALAFADNYHCRYLHTPFQRISHVEGDVATWTRRWEEFFGLAVASVKCRRTPRSYCSGGLCAYFGSIPATFRIRAWWRWRPASDTASSPWAIPPA